MPDYSITKVQNVIIVYAPQGLSAGDFAQICALAGDDAFMDPALAIYLDAHTVCGSKSALANMRLNPPEPGHATATEVAQANHLGLSDSAIRWLLSFDRGQSSESLFSMATGLDLRSGHRINIPQDSSDFNRCTLLARTCTEVSMFIESPDRTERLKSYAAGHPNLSAWLNLLNQWEAMAKMDAATLSTFFKEFK